DEVDVIPLVLKIVELLGMPEKAGVDDTLHKVESPSSMKDNCSDKECFDLGIWTSSPEPVTNRRVHHRQSRGGARRRQMVRATAHRRQAAGPPCDNSARRANHF